MFCPSFCIGSIISEKTFGELSDRVNGEVEAAVEFAKASPLPEDADLYRDVFVETQGEETV